MENNEMKTVNSSTYLERIHKYGKIWGIVLWFLLMGLPFVIAIVFKALPNWSALWKGMLAIVPMYWAVGIIEVFTYVPMLGAGGTYLSFVTGNISNLKLPCALDAMEKVGVNVNSEEGEIISTISIAVSSIVTMFVIILGVILIIPLQPILESKALTASFDQILPALFGGLAVVFVSKNWKVAIAPIILMLLLFVFVPALNSGTVGIMVPVGVIFTIGYARLLYKKGLI